jgi:ribonuclease HII
LSDTLPGLEAVARPATAGYEVEDELRAAGALRIAGVDEVGRGSWAGPVVVCAAVTDFSAPPQLPRPDGSPVRLTDSKLLTARHRVAFAEVLPGWLMSFAIGAAGPEEIDEVGLTEALRRAALRAIETLPVRPDAVILDGRHDYITESQGRSGLRGLPLMGRLPVRCQIKADQSSITVAAASVLAKVHRDRLMASLAPRHPGFGFEENAGYPSPGHQAALARFGPTRHHRLSWSYLDDLPEWRHLKKARRRPDEDQLSLC